jgi:glycosyltransferase involved in cell wall biosynthesis
MSTEDTKVQRVAMLAHTLYLLDPRVRREAEALAQEGVEVHVIGLSEEGWTAQPHPSDPIVNGVHIHRLPIRKKRGNALRYLYEYFMTAFLGGLKLAALHFRGKLTVVHVHNMPDILVLAAAVPRMGGSKLVLDIHDPMPEISMSSANGSSKKFLVRLLRLQEKISCKLADRVISVSESLRENLRAKGVPDEKLFILHNFPDQRVFPICDIPASWPRNKNSLSLFYCGTVTEHYDLALVVKAIARLAGEIPVKLRIAGVGHTLAAVLDLARSLGVAESIQPIGVIPLERVHEEMRKADVGISCQRGSVLGHLMLSTKIVEYLTQGLPVLTPNTYTVSKYLPADCVFYHEPGNDAAVADALRLMWYNPAEVLKRVTRARQLLPRLSWQAEKERFLGFYGALLNNTRLEQTQQLASKATTAGRHV